MNHHNNNENKKECEECYRRQVCNLDPSYINPKTNETIKCPCSICLVRIICKGEAVCREYGRYVYYHRSTKNKGDVYMTRYDERREECKGCYIRGSCMILPSYIDLETNEVITCPCIECLVKTMCNDNNLVCRCDKYSDYCSGYNTKYHILNVIWSRFSI